MTWQTPPEDFHEIEPAIQWWLDAHFILGDDNAGTWAIDLYASYIEAAVETKKIPIVNIHIFGRAMKLFSPMTKNVRRVVDGEAKSGYMYCVRPKEGVVLYVAGRVDNGAKAARAIWLSAQECTGYQQTTRWLEFKDEVLRDKTEVERFLVSQKLGPPPNGERLRRPVAVRPLYRKFRDWDVGSDWSEVRFRRALSQITRLYRGDGGARQVADLREVAA